MSTSYIVTLALVSLVPLLAILHMTGYLEKIFTYVYGEFTPTERKKFILYGILFFCIIGTYWLLRSVKDSIFTAFADKRTIYQAKLLSPIIIAPLAVGYSYLLDRFPRHRMFYAMGTIYAIVFGSLALLLNNTSFGMYAAESDRFVPIGWASYIAVESFGSLMVVLFYSFMADTTTPEDGKKAFYITASFGQIGSMIGAGVVQQYAIAAGVPVLVTSASIACIFIPLFVAYIVSTIPAEEFRGYQTSEKKGKDEANKKAKSGFIEGLKLIITQPYLLGIFFVVAAFEVVATVFDLQFKILVGDYAQGDANIFAEYMGGYGVYVSALALASILLGIGKVGRKIGLKMSLAFMAVLMTVNVLIIAFTQVVLPLEWQLSIAFSIMVISKGINYALGQPAKEQLYIPTSRDTKYKSKSWVDMFGSRVSKAAGGGIQGLSALVPASFVSIAPAIALLGVCGLWLATALFVGNKHREALANNEVVC